MPRRTTTEQEKARRDTAARLAVILAFVLCAGVFLFGAVEYGLSFRRESAAVFASNDAAPRVLLDDEEEKTDINQATEADLKAVPGIGPKLAQRIIALREARGGFSFLEELTDVSGIGEKRFDALKEYFYCPLPEAVISPSF